MGPEIETSPIHALGLRPPRALNDVKPGAAHPRIAFEIGRAQNRVCISGKPFRAIGRASGEEVGP